MKMKRISAIACVLVTLILIAVSCLTVFAAGDISGAIESTWNDAKSQIESVVNNVVIQKAWAVRVYGTGNTFCLSDFHDHRAALYLDSHLDLKSFSHNIVSIAYSMCGICSVELCLKPLYYSLDRV